MLANPKAYARRCGLLYLAVTVLGVFAEMYVRGALVVHGDPAATAQRIAGAPLLWNAGVLANVVAGACYIAVTWMLYELLKPVDASLSFMAVFFSVTGCAVGAIVALGDFAVPYASADPALLKILLALHGPGYDIALFFFGVYCTLLGYLTFRSGYFPKFVGVLLLAGGPCYVINTVLDLLARAWWAAFPLDITLLSGVAELALTLWLLAVGVDLPKWKQKACSVSPSSAAA